MEKAPIPIEVPFSSSGFQRFISLWLIIGDSQNIIIDVGPSNTTEGVIRKIKELGIKDIHYVLLTHIHLDHAGGIATFIKNFPMCRVICHKKAIPHLISPDRLWDGSKRVLDGIATIYGRPEPVEEEYLISHETAKVEGLKIIETPGHAPHHLSFIYNNMLFPGEACGNLFTYNGIEYIRPATPPPFFLEKFMQSIDLLPVNKHKELFLSHFRSVKNPVKYIRRFKAQIHLWQKTISKELSTSADLDKERCLNLILNKDPELRRFNLLPEPIRKRERFFLNNSISGFIDHFKRIRFISHSADN